MKEFGSLGEFAAHLAVVVDQQIAAQNHAMGKAARLVEKAAKDKIGEYQGQAGPFAGWPELADSTKADRVRQGFPENDPLLRTGQMRDSIEHRAGPVAAHIGSDLDIAVYQELGTATIPPRSFLGGAAFEKGEEVAQILGGGVVSALVGEGVFGGKLLISGE